MAWAGPVENEEFASPSGSGSSYTFSPNSTIPVGTLMILGWTGNVNSATAATCADNSAQPNSANSYTALATQTTTGPSLAGGLLWCVTTRAILATDVITITVPSATRRHARMVTFTGQAASPLDFSLDQGPDIVSPFDIGPSGTLAETSELVVACAFVANTAGNALGASDSTSGYTLLTPAGSGGTGTVTWTVMSYKTTAGTSAETDSQAYTSFNKAVGQMIAFKLAPPSAAQRSRIIPPRRAWAGR